MRRLLLLSGGNVVAGKFQSGAAKGISRQLNVNHDHKVLVLDMTDVPLIDTSGGFAVDDIVSRALESDTEIVFAGLNEGAKDVLERLGVLEKIPEDRLAANRSAALETAETLLS